MCLPAGRLESSFIALPFSHRRTTGWMDDEDKCIFIVLDRGIPDGTAGEPSCMCPPCFRQKPWSSGNNRRQPPPLGGTGGSMAGDVNLFLNDSDGAGIAELDVMIAEERSRRRGLGRAAVKAMMAFAAARLPAVRGFCVRINDDNEPSLGLFRSLGFAPESHSEVFKQAR